MFCSTFGIGKFWQSEKHRGCEVLLFCDKIQMYKWNRFDYLVLPQTRHRRTLYPLSTCIISPLIPLTLIFLSLIFFSNYVEVQKYANKQLKIKTCVFCLILPICQYEHYHDISKHMAVHTFNACIIHFRWSSLVQRFAFAILTRCFSPIWEWLVGLFDKQKTFLEVKGR